MNIFVTDPDPAKSAQSLPDKHIVKMPLESCQMLAIVASTKWGHGFGKLPKLDGTPYLTDKGAFRGHPCTIWAQENYRWLIEHGLALCAEYTNRYGKVHSCQHTLEHAKMIFPPSNGEVTKIGSLATTSTGAVLVIRIGKRNIKIIIEIVIHRFLPVKCLFKKSLIE